METWDALRARRNVRTFTPQPIAATDLDQILEAGRRAPSASNWQPWDFVVVTDRDQLERLAGVWRGAGHIARAAAAIAIVAPRVDDARRTGLLQYDLGQATMSIMLARYCGGVSRVAMYPPAAPRARHSVMSQSHRRAMLR